VTATALSDASNLFLIGYRGTGKTAVAQVLARRLGWEAVDADEVLEQRHGRTIAQIFAAEGESGFREKEESLLAELCQGKQRVIATGGGVILRPVNQERMGAAGRCIWLTADAATLWERLQKDRATLHRRPNLTVGGLAEIEELLRVREPLYRSCADWIVDTKGRTAEEVAEIIAKELQIAD